VWQTLGGLQGLQGVKQSGCTATAELVVQAVAEEPARASKDIV
jgi:hypothetical protein